MKTPGMLAAVGLFAAHIGCGDSDRPLPPIEDVTRVITIGDAAAASPGYATSYVPLLISNDDTLHPELAGSDLDTLLGGVDVVRLERGGDSYHALASLDRPFCTCEGAQCPGAIPCVDVSVDAQTLAVVQLGTNDALDALVKIVFDPLVADDPDALIETMRLQMRSVLDVLNDPAVFPTRPLIVVVSPIDPADGEGDLVAVAEMFYPQLNAVAIDQETLDYLIDGFLRVLEEEADRADALFVDLNEHFLGHGYHFDDTAAAHYDASDATLWVNQLFAVNYRGAHEMRRAIWNALVPDNPITGLPGALPTVADGGELPTVPTEGWANAVVDSDITEMYTANDREWVNVADDPMLAVGEPDDDQVAIGIVGAFIVLDFGAGEEAHDGDGPDIVVLEQGPASGGAPEPYRVYLSNDPGGPWTPIADGRGERAFDMAGSGLTSARYVRIESQAHIPDVMSGLGSPLYPGGEIDAVGAVYAGGTP